MQELDLSSYLLLYIGGGQHNSGRQFKQIYEGTALAWKERGLVRDVRRKNHEHIGDSSLRFISPKASRSV